MPVQKPGEKMRKTLQQAEAQGMETLADPKPPVGAQEEIEDSASAGFFGFEVQGEQLVGTLVGSVKIKNQQQEERLRYRLLPDGETEPVILPDHWDLNDKIDRLLVEHAMPVRVWIAYRGVQPANTPAGYVKRYKVAIMKEQPSPKARK
jgi:hypothetical protein